MVCIYFLAVGIKYSMIFGSDNQKKEFIRISEDQFSKKYTFIEQVGKGVYGEVFKAKSIHNTIVAIKKFKAEAAQLFHLIIREISNLKKLDHPNILKFYDCYIVNGNRYYMVTQYCAGGSLTNLIPTLTQDWEKMLICQQAAEGIAYAHKKKIVHRDLKPDNILIGAKNVAKIGDFGSSTRLNNSEIMSSRVGSPAYMDERVDKSQNYDNTADIYSLGMVFLCIFKGKGIYDQCKTIADLKRFKSQINMDYDNNIEEHINELPQPIRDIVKNCLNPDYSIRLPAETIASMIAAKLSKEKMGSRNLISTQDEVQEVVESEKNIFACSLIALNHEFEAKHRSLHIKDKLFKVLVHNQQNFEKIALIQKLRYVCADTKAEFSFIVAAAYDYWLGQITLIIHSDYSELEYKYREIDPKIIEQEDREKALLHIKGEREKTASVLWSCARRISGTVELMDKKKKYIPEHFKEFVKQASQKEGISFDQVSYSELLGNIGAYFRERIQKEHDYERGKEEPDEKLKELKTIEEGFM